DNTDEQTLSEVLGAEEGGVGAEITGLGAPTVGSDAATKDYVDGLDTDDADNDPTNEMNTRFEVIGSNLEIEDGNGTLQVSLDDLGTDDQALTLTDNTLELEDGGSVNLGMYLDNTDEQTLSEVLAEGNDALGAVITGLGAPTVGSDAATKDYVDGLDTDDADNDPTNEMNTRFEVIGSNLEIEDGNGTLQVSLDDLGTDDQALTLTGNTLALEDGGTVN